MLRRMLISTSIPFECKHRNSIVHSRKPPIVAMARLSATLSAMLRVVQRIGRRDGANDFVHRNMELRRRQHTVGYQAIGSFHSEDVDELMNQIDNVYNPPELPFEPRKSHISSLDSNRDFSKDFLLDLESFTFLNHGAFGAALRTSYGRAEQWRYHLERQPLRYFDRDLLPHLVYSARRLAAFCGADRSSLTLIQNVTSGLNTILKGYSKHYKDQAHIVLWDTTYGSLKKISRRYCEKVTEIPVSDYFNLFDEGASDDVFQKALLDFISSSTTSGADLKNALLILDHTTSNTALNMNLKALSLMAKDHGMITMVDGAHALLAQDVNLKSMENIDFFLANGHKWLSCPRGIGVLHCPYHELRETVLKEPAVMSHGVGDGYQSAYLWDGCRDYSAALSAPAALDYWESLGAQLVQRRMRCMLEDAVRLLGSMWHPSEFDATTTIPVGVTLAPLSIHAPMMALVRLPQGLQKRDTNGGVMGTKAVATSEDAKRIQDFLYDNQIEVPIKCIRGTLYVRISCHIYNQISDYERLGSTLVFDTSSIAK